MFGISLPPIPVVDPEDRGVDPEFYLVSGGDTSPLAIINTTYYDDDDDDDTQYIIPDYDINDSLSTFSWEELGPSLSVYSLTFLLGVLGNVLILIAVVSRNNQFVKTSPVNVFLGSLASADLLLILICLPLKVKICRDFNKNS